MIYKTGVYQMSLDEYHSDPAPIPSLSRSVIKDLIFRSPAHAWFNHPRLNQNFKPEKDEAKFDIGNVAHALLLEGLDNMVIVDAEDWRKKEAREQREIARQQGKTPLLKHQCLAVKEICKSAIEQIQDCKELGINRLRSEGEVEQSYFWSEEETWLRVRPDWKKEDLILDYKTSTQSVNPYDLARMIINMGYDIQAALYCRGVKAVENIDPKFIFIFQEIEEPYLCSFVGLPPTFMDMAKSKVEYGIFLWKECMKTGKWPGYPQQVAWIDCPEWTIAAWDNRAKNIGIGGNEL